jgi:hypothetical protein
MEKSNLRERIEEIALAKKVGLHLNPVAEEIAKLEELIELQDTVMTELSKTRGENLVKLWKLRGEKTYGY